MSTRTKAQAKRDRDHEVRHIGTPRAFHLTPADALRDALLMLDGWLQEADYERDATSAIELATDAVTEALDLLERRP